ncbi:hypothetical protein FQN54_004291 [Arachnomyces sp. PD_36]|nr:hypothetical protein FQN54_004291 [Arachnomyces sp. PD_36]
MPTRNNQYSALSPDDQLPGGDNALFITSNRTSAEDNSLGRAPLLNRRGSPVYELIETSNVRTEDDDAEKRNSRGFLDSKDYQSEGGAIPRPTGVFGWILRPVQKIWWGKNCSGWRMTVALCILLTVVMLLVNIGVTIWGSKKRLQDGYHVLIENDCAKSKSWSRWSHLGINVISTLLLGASNYTMQCLVAPTRAEVDNAHRKEDWVDIGIPSVRNLSRVSRRRVSLWLLLGLSSLPLHLLFNSAVFSVTSGNSYWRAVVTQKFAQDAQLNGTNIQFVDFSSATEQGKEDFMHMRERIRAGNSTLEVLESPEACIKEYRNALLSKRGNLFIVTDGTTNEFAPKKSYPIKERQVPMDPLYWICDHYEDRQIPACDVDGILQQVEKGQPWMIGDNSVKWCLSETFNEECRLQFFPSIMTVVIACNAVKAVVMVLTLFMLLEDPLATIGDAAASFLTDPDPTTKGNCLLSRDDLRLNYLGLKVWERKPHKWVSRPRKWASAASVGRWVVCMLGCLVTLIVVLALLGVGIGSLKTYGVDTSLTSLWALGFGDVDVNSLLRIGEGGTLSHQDKALGYVFLANSPQLVLSFIYITYNGLYTCMLLSREWVRYSTERNGLRTTYPRGKQRSTYYLQIPYRYSLPLMATSGLMHWLISQSLFLVAIDLYDSNHKPETISTDKAVTAGYSCIPILFSLLVGVIMVVVCIVIGMRKYPPGIPLAANCSAAISAACHAPDKNPDAAYLPVKWGAVPRVVDSDSASEVGHCCLSSEEVVTPTPGALYAGL